jgi:spore coat protein CotH
MAMSRLCWSLSLATDSDIDARHASELALRTEGPRGDELILEEMVTAEVLEVAGLPFPETSYTGLSINGGPETLRVVVELLDDGYVERLFDDDGVLYKAQSGDSFTYLGHDPTAYEGAFTQETATNEADLEPLLDFLEFVDTATDEEFEAELDDWLDVDSFTDYVAINNLLASVDSMPGNGNNYYLWYDAGDDRFTVLAWDLNESFGGFWMTSSEPSTGLLPDWSNLTESGTFGGNGVLGGGPPARGPGGAGGGPGPEGGGARPADGGGVTFDYANPLVDRFLATESFLEAYEDRYAELYETLFENDVLFDLIDEYSALLAAGNVDRTLVTDAELESGTAAKRQWVTDRMTFLAGVVEG